MADRTTNCGGCEGTQVIGEHMADDILDALGVGYFLPRMRFPCPAELRRPTYTLLNVL